MTTRSLLVAARDALAEIGDLKRIGSAGRVGSIATRLFGDAWAMLVADRTVGETTFGIVAHALAATRLGDLDRDVMVRGGMPTGDVATVRRAAIDAVMPSCGAQLMSDVLAGAAMEIRSGGVRPVFVDALARQPRAGITCPGKPRILLEPPESHADHCLVVAVYGVLLSPVYGADPAAVFLASLAHHFHNAGMPDSGFTGEMLLGPHLGTLIAHYTDQCLRQLPTRLRDEVATAREILTDADTPEGRAFHAADVLDRVLQTMQYKRAAALTAERMLGDMELVHAGPVKAFHDEVLREAGLL